MFTSDHLENRGLHAHQHCGDANALGHFHRHNEIEINFLTHGKMVYNLGARVVPLPARALSVFWGGFSHRGVEWEPGSEILVSCIPLDMFLAWGLPREAFVHPLLHGEILCEPEPAAGDGDETSMRRWHADIRGSRLLRREASLLEIRARLLRLADSANGARVRFDAAPGCVGKMLQCVAAHYNDPGLSVARIAEHAGVHPNYAMEVFKKTCGVSLMRYVSRQRVAHAQRLLGTTGAKVLDVAMEAGFGSISQFYHVFQTVIGSAPREYAKAHGNDLRREVRVRRRKR